MPQTYIRKQIITNLHRVCVKYIKKNNKNCPFHKLLIFTRLCLMQMLVYASEHTFVTLGPWVFSFQKAFQTIWEGKIITAINDGKNMWKKGHVFMKRQIYCIDNL